MVEKLALLAQLIIEELVHNCLTEELARFGPGLSFVNPTVKENPPMGYLKSPKSPA